MKKNNWAPFSIHGVLFSAYNFYAEIQETSKEAA